MRNVLRILITALCAASLLTVSVSAHSRQITMKEAETAAVSAPRDSKEFISEMRRLFFDAVEKVRKNSGDSMAPTVKCFAIALLCTAVGLFNEKAERMAVLSGSAAMIAVIIKDCSSVIGVGGEIIEKMSALSQSMMPVMTASAIASGGFNSAAYTGVVFAGDVICTVVKKLMMPVMYVHIAIALAVAVSENSGLKKVKELIYSIVSGMLKLIVSLYAAYLMSGKLIGKAGGALTVKTVKLVSGAIPVIGGVISDSAEAVIAGASALRASIGLVGIISIAGMCIAPILTVALKSFSFAFAAAFIEMAGGKGFSALMQDISRTFGLVLAFVGTCSMMIMSGIYVFVMGAGV